MDVPTPTPTPTDAPPPTPPPTPLQAALLKHRDNLVPGAAGQLAVLLSGEVAGLPASIVGDVVDARLRREDWQHWLLPGARQGAAAPAPAPAAPAEPIVGVIGPRAQQVAANGAAVGQQLAAGLQAARANAAPGLGGTYK